MSEKVQFNGTPVGRLVQGDLFTPQTTDNNGAPLLIKTGPNKGQPAVKYFFAVAFPKNDPDWPAFQALILNECMRLHPQLMPGGIPSPLLSTKIVDGDCRIVDVKGKCNADKEGFAGHHVVKFSSGFYSKVFTNEAVPVEMGQGVQRGDYVRVQGSITDNKNTEKPGVFINHSMVQFIGYGTPILGAGGGDPTTFGAPAALPAGASATPLAASPTMPPVAAPAAIVPPAVAVPPVAVATYVPPVAPVVAPPVAVPPAPVVAPPVAVIPPAPVAVPPPVPTAPAPDFLEPKVLHPNGTIYTVKELVAQGWGQADIAALTPA